MKRLIVCCDGTWQDLNTAHPTNVVKIMQAIPMTDQDGVSQVVFYGAGVGTDPLTSILGGAFGRGINPNILDAYRFLCANYAPGDQIYVFGFSRGAYTARSLCGLIRTTGLLPRANIRYSSEGYDLYKDSSIGVDDMPAEKFRERYNCTAVKIDFLGCWDTVGSLGVPDVVSWLPFNKLINKKHRFHDIKVSSFVLNARHAVAIDERRAVFDVTRMGVDKDNPDRVQERWFCGDHGAVGGGSAHHKPLSDVSLEWMMTEACRVPNGLHLDSQLIPTGIDPNGDAKFDNSVSGVYRFQKPIDRDMADVDYEHIDDSVKSRWSGNNNYRSASLGRFSDDLNSFSTPSS